MAGITVPASIFMTMMLMIIGLAFGFVLFYIDIRNNCPGALVIKKAYKNNLPLVVVHYPSRDEYLYIPKTDKYSEDIASPYHIVEKVGIKFKSSDGTKVSRWFGLIPMYHYYVNTPEPAAIADAVAVDQLKEFLKTKGIEIDTIEDVAVYILSEYEKHGDLSRALANAQIDGEEVIERITSFMNGIKKHKDEIESLKLQSGLFTFQTAIRAFDSISAYTSSHVAHMKSVLEAAIRRELSDTQSDMLKYGIFIFMCMLGLGCLYILVRK